MHTRIVFVHPKEVNGSGTSLRSLLFMCSHGVYKQEHTKAISIVLSIYQ